MRRRRRRFAQRRNHRIELAWIFIPLGLFFVMFAWAAELYYEHATPPADAMDVYVVGKQWMWKLEHAGGQREIDELHVPAGRPVRLVMTSQDVIHDFFMPVFRIKQDVLPGRYTILWFNATKPGDYHLFCSQYCGTDHSRMIGHVVVMAPAAFEAWLARGDGVADDGGARRGALPPIRLQRLPRRQRVGARAQARGLVRQAGAARGRRNRHRRRALHPRLGDAAAEGGRRGLRADHAVVPGPDRRGGPARHRRVHQVAARCPRRRQCDDRR